MRLVVVLVLVAVALYVADRLAVHAVERAVATRLQAELGGSPEVEIRGGLFLPQALRGRYDDVIVRAPTVPTAQVQLTDFVAQLSGVRLPLADAVQGTVTQVPVDRLTARAVLPYSALTARLAERGLRVGPAGEGLIRVTGDLRVLGATKTVHAVSRPVLEGNEVVFSGERFEVGNGVADTVISAALGNRLDFRIPVAGLPYGLQLTAVRVGGDGVVLEARSDGAVLARP